jgi:hypothetical protein
MREAGGWAGPSSRATRPPAFCASSGRRRSGRRRRRRSAKPQAAHHHHPPYLRRIGARGEYVCVHVGIGRYRCKRKSFVCVAYAYDIRHVAHVARGAPIVGSITRTHNVTHIHSRTQTHRLIIYIRTPYIVYIIADIMYHVPYLVLAVYHFCASISSIISTHIHIHIYTTHNSRQGKHRQEMSCGAFWFWLPTPAS